MKVDHATVNSADANSTTGGTFDKQYFDALSEYKIAGTVVETLLNRARVEYPYRLVELLKKDSLEITDADRAAIVACVRDAPERQIVIVHGTDTMTQTAAALGTDLNKTVVLTGALTPALFSESDAVFNLGMAVASVQCLEQGVYIAMNGTIFIAGSVRKDRSAGKFLPI